jgi:ubiquinol-cytochrome c reductase cytochrome b subunit
MPAEEPYVMWARIFTFLYFAYFLIAMPLVGLIETPSQMPRSITESVLGASKPGSGGGGQMPAGVPAGPEKR